MTNPENITRQQLYAIYMQSPESAPLKLPALVSTQAAKDYRFETELARFTSPAAGGLVAEAQRDAQIVKQGYAGPMTRGIVAMIAGVLAFTFTTSFPPLFIAALVGFYYGTTWIRQATDKLRQSNYDTRFAADVVRYANQASNAGY